MKSLHTCLTILLFAFGLVVIIDSAINGNLLAAENSYLIEVDRLTREVNNGLARATRASHSKEKQIHSMEKGIKTKVEKVRSARSEPELTAYQKEYLADRADILAIRGEQVETSESELTKLVDNFDRLEEAQKKSRAFGLGDGIKAGDIKAQTAVAEVLRGQQNLLKMISKVSPETRVGNQADALQVKINVANKFFANRSSISINEQKRYVVDALLLVREVKNLLIQAHDDLLQKLYYVDARHTVHQLSNLRVAMLGSVVNGSTGLSEIQKLDDEVISMEVSGDSERFSVRQSNYHPGLNTPINFGLQ